MPSFVAPDKALFGSAKPTGKMLQESFLNSQHKYMRIARQTERLLLLLTLKSYLFFHLYLANLHVHAEKQN